MISSSDCYRKYGNPIRESNMTLWIVPHFIQLGPIPKKIYCNKDLIEPLATALENVISQGITDQIKTWDGCFNIRSKRGSSNISLHAWGIAIDINAAWNRFGKQPTMSKELVNCFKTAGFDWGGDWKSPRIDGMHFQLSRI